VTAGLIAPLGATLVAFRVNPMACLPYPSSVINNDSSMAVISIMVKRGDLWGDTANGNLLPLRPTGDFDALNRTAMRLFQGEIGRQRLS
jgi:hypothetical protein